MTPKFKLSGATVPIKSAEFQNEVGDQKFFNVAFNHKFNHLHKIYGGGSVLLTIQVVL